MNKSLLYISLLFGLLGAYLFFAMYADNYRDIVLEREGLQFTKLEQLDLLNFSATPIVFITNNATTSERLVHYAASSYQNKWFTHRNVEDSLSYDALFVAAIQGRLAYQDSLEVKGWQAKLAYLDQFEEVEARQLLQQYNITDLFSFLDDSPFVVFLLALIIFCVLLFVDVISYLLKHFVHPWGEYVWKFALIFSLWLFFTMVDLACWMPVSDSAMMLRSAITIFGGYALFQWVNIRFVPKLSVSDAELLKFCTMLLGVSGLFYVSNLIAYQWDVQQYERVIWKGFKSPILLGYAFIFAATLGNLLNNLRKHWLKLRSKARLLNNSKQETLASKAELEALQASINPHFLYNALNSIAALAPQDAQKTEQMALSLSAFYQYATNKNGQHEATLQEELEMLQEYLAVEKIRFGEKLQVEIDTSEAALTAKLPRFTLQPILENAIKYGSDGTQLRVKVKATQQGNKLQIQIFDSGKVFDTDLKMGYGLESVSKKLRLLYPERHRLEFVNTPEKHVLLELG